MEDLRKCPFCGGEAKVFVNDCITIKCMKCHVQTTPRQDFCIADCEKFNAFEKSVRDWNRTPDPIEPYEYEGTWYCGNCHDPINKGDKFCHECGQAVKWE